MAAAVHRVLAIPELLNQIIFEALAFTPRFNDDNLVRRQRKADRIALTRVSRHFAYAVQAVVYSRVDFRAGGVPFQRFGQHVASSPRLANLVRDLTISNLPNVPPAPGYVGPFPSDAVVIAEATAVLSHLRQLGAICFEDSPPAAMATIVAALVKLDSLHARATLPSQLTTCTTSPTRSRACGVSLRKPAASFV